MCAPFFKDSQHVIQCLGILAQDPVAILTHDGQPMHHDGLPTAQYGAQPPRVKGLRQILVNMVLPALVWVPPTSCGRTNTRNRVSSSVRCIRVRVAVKKAVRCGRGAKLHAYARP